MTNQATQTAGITDQEYLELADHCKKLVELAQLEVGRLKRENKEYKKMVMSAYGFIRVLDEQFDIFLPTEATYVLESIRSYLSDFVENQFL